MLKIEGAINPISSEYIQDGIEKAEEEGAECILLIMDTPGGLMNSMRDITKAFMNSGVPIVVYVHPRGSRAASAGVFITMAAHIAVMAPSTNIGAAHPVSMGQQENDEEQQKAMMEKVENDAVAQLRSISEERGRNADWAEDAIRKSASIGAQEAMELNVIDTIADNLGELLDYLEGKIVMLEKGPDTLKTGQSEIIEYKMKPQHRVLYKLLDPTVAYLLMMLGMLGIFLELSHPGSILPGVVGGISILVALYAFQILPVNYVGVLLIVFGIILFILEIKIPSFGILTIGGVIALGFGSFLLTSGNAQFLKVSLKVMLPTVVGVSAFFTFIIAKGLAGQIQKVSTGKEGLIGEIGIVQKSLSPEGKILIHGEIWNARSSERLKKGTMVKVISIEPMLWLYVEKYR